MDEVATGIIARCAPLVAEWQRTADVLLPVIAEQHRRVQLAAVEAISQIGRALR
jgi:hypothetical protein